MLMQANVARFTKKAYICRELINYSYESWT